MKIHPIPSTCILLISLLGTANAGLMITEQDEGMTESTIYQDGVMIKLDDNKKVEAIVDPQKKQCTWVNHANRKFARGCQVFSDVTDLISDMDSMRDTYMDDIDTYMDDIMSKMPPEQRAIMEQEMKNEKRNLPTFQAKKIGSTNFQGFAVNKFHFLIEGNPIAEVWLSPDLYEALSKEVNEKAFNSIFGSDEDKKNVSGFDSPDMQELLENEIETLAEKENAYVIKQMKFISKNDPSEVKIFGSQVIEIKTKKFDLDQYRLPSGYKEVGSFSELIGLDLN